MNDVAKSQSPDALSFIAIANGVLAVGAIAVGAIAVGAIAVGAIAIGRLAIGRLAVQRVRLQNVEIENLTVRRLRVLESSTPGTRAAAADVHPSDTSLDATPDQNGEARPAPRRRRPRKPVPN